MLLNKKKGGGGGDKSHCFTTQWPKHGLIHTIIKLNVNKTKCLRGRILGGIREDRRNTSEN